MKSDYKVIKLDRRHNGFPQFTHAIDFKNGIGWTPSSNSPYIRNIINFNYARAWLYTTYGYGTEVASTSIVRSEPNIEYPVWAYNTERVQMKLYVTEDILTMFRLWYVDNNAR